MSDKQAAGIDEMSDQQADSDSKVNIQLMVVLMYNFQESITESICNTITKDAMEQSNKFTSHSNWVESQLKV